MPFRDLGHGVRLHFADRGVGRPLVLVHGWSLSHHAFTPQIAALSARFRVVALDLRGHGQSSAGDGSFAVEDFAHDVASLFEAAELRGAILVGWSWGAEVALASLARIRERVGALALLSATPRFTSGAGWAHGLPESRVRALRARLVRAPAETRRAFVEGMFAEGELSAAERERIVDEQLAAPLDDSAARATLDALAACDLRDRLLDAAELPALLVHGERDAICLPAASAWISGQLPRSRRVVLAGAGHAPQLSRAAEVTALLAELAGSVA